MSVTHVQRPTTPKAGATSFRVTPAGGESKAEMARDIFKRMVSEPRKAVLEQFITEAGLTKAGAATYYQNFRKESGVITSRRLTAIR